MGAKILLKEQDAQRVMIVGAGNFGCKVAERLNEQKQAGFTIVACDTDQHDLESTEVPNRLLLEAENTSFVSQIIKKSVDYLCADEGDITGESFNTNFTIVPIRKLLNDDSDTVIVVAGMGGKCGTEAAASIAREAKAAGKRTAAVVTLPFPFEGEQRMEKAIKGVACLLPYVGELHVMNFENKIDSNTIAARAFDMAEEMMCEAVTKMAEPRLSGAKTL
jgi:cell division protein FtsZ